MNHAEAIRLGHRIAQARRNKGLSIRSAAKEAGVSFAWLARLEQGYYLDPAPEHVLRVMAFLDVELPKRDRGSREHISESLPGVRTYFRSKYDLSTEEIDRIERVVQEIQHNHERGNHDTNRHKNNSD